jgi:transcriptional regulator with XRE-family HTH domain
VRSFLKASNPRREMYLALAGSIESQLRDAFARQSKGGNVSQSSLAKKLGINRSAVHKRLTGQTNMTIETIADMLWALDKDFNFSVFDKNMPNKNNNEQFQPTEIISNFLLPHINLNKLSQEYREISKITPTSQMPMLKIETKSENKEIELAS